MHIADTRGLDAVSMRRVADELGAEAMSLYHHVASKEDLLRGVVDLVLGEIDLAPAGPSWKGRLRRIALSAHEVLVRHPWAAGLVLSQSDGSVTRLRYMERMLGTLRRAGLPPELTDQAYHVLDSHIIGFSLWVGGMQYGSEENLRVLATAFLKQLPADEFPHLVEHVEHHLKPADPRAKSAFEFGLDLLLDGIERMAAEHGELAYPSLNREA
jgi:AcrR family transcriptional regulator